MESEMKTEMEGVIDHVKAEGYTVASVPVGGTTYVFRAVTRSEWRKLLSERAGMLKDVGEDPGKMLEIQENESERLVDMCVVYPKINASNMLAGAVVSLSDQILLLSGFGGPDLEAKRL